MRPPSSENPAAEATATGLIEEHLTPANLGSPSSAGNPMPVSSPQAGAKKRQLAAASRRRARALAECTRQLSAAWSDVELAAVLAGFAPDIAGNAIWQLVRNDTLDIAELHRQAQDHHNRIDAVLRVRAAGIAAGHVAAGMVGSREGRS